MRTIARQSGHLTRAMALLLLALLLSSFAMAANPVGAWVTERSEAVIRIAPCGDALCGRISALKEPRDPQTGRPKTDNNNRDARLRDRPLIGVTIVVGMRPNGVPGQWAGQVYNPDDGRFYPAKLILVNASVLRLEGCMIKDVLCDGQTWVRAR